CNYHGGFVIDVGSHLRQGNNHIDVEVENTGGAHGLAIHSVRGAESGGWRAIAILLALVAACAAASFALARRAPPASRWAAVAFVALAGWLRYRYVFDWHAPECFLFSDMANYYDMARALSRGITNPYQTFQPVGYPLLIVQSFKLHGDLLLLDWAHVLAGWATV